MTVDWETVIGLEVHVQLATHSKLFCGCSTRYGDKPNSNVCPVCLGLPGALPVTNAQAVALATRASLSLGCNVHVESEFARKNYFYPDLPKGYQISQFDCPLATGGGVTIDSPDRGGVDIRLTRLHLEEDAGKSIHDRYEGLTAVDYNRAGIPLAEIVTEADLRTPQETRLVLDQLKQTLQYISVSDCSMELGRLRVDVNVSVRPRGDVALGVKQEAKNLNSFAAVERVIRELRDSQIETLQAGQPVAQATFSAGVGPGRLRMTRRKEESHDYRYFPDPDLPILHLDDRFITGEATQLPELPRVRRKRLRNEFGLTESDAVVITATRDLADYFEAVVHAGSAPLKAAHWVTGPVLRDANEHAGRFRVSPSSLATLIGLVADGTISNQAAKRVFVSIAGSGKQPFDVAKTMGVLQVSDGSAIGTWIDAVFVRYPDELKRLRGGEDKLLGFFMGQVMKESKGSADPKSLSGDLRKRLHQPDDPS